MKGYNIERIKRNTYTHKEDGERKNREREETRKASLSKIQM